MNKINELMPGFCCDHNTLRYQSDELLTTLFNYFAAHIDSRIRDDLVSDLMSKYVEVSKMLEETNVRLKQYNERLEELVQEKVMDITAAQTAVIHALVKLSESRDDDTGAHIERTSGYCRLLAERIKTTDRYAGCVDDSYAEEIEKASPLHDIGKVGIADAILLKPAKLTGDEFELMKTHVMNGYDTLASVEKSYPGNKFLKMGMDISKYHHEKWDGSGYMYGLAGEDIPLSARVMALSDVYDALRSKRVYKEAFSHEKAIDLIARGRGTHFDPVLTDIFLSGHSGFREVFDRLSA